MNSDCIVVVVHLDCCFVLLESHIQSSTSLTNVSITTAAFDCVYHSIDSLSILDLTLVKRLQSILVDLNTSLTLR